MSCENYWLHILAESKYNFEAIKVGSYILEFKSSGIEYDDPKTRLRDAYYCNDVYKCHILAIGKVILIQNEELILENVIVPNEQIKFPKDRIEDGHFYISQINDLESALPGDWEL